MRVKQQSPIPMRVLWWVAAVAALDFVALLVVFALSDLLHLPEAVRYTLDSATIGTVIVATVTWMLWG